MTDDSMESILSDCTINPEDYCRKWCLGRGAHGEPGDYVPDMCTHLVGRTEAVMRRDPAHLAGVVSGFRISDKVVSGFRIGDKVVRENGRIGTVIGFAVGKDGRSCLVLSMHGGHWRTYLCPIDEARKLEVPTPAQVRSLIMGAIESAAGGDDRDAEAAEREADRIIDVARACFRGEPIPIGSWQRHRDGGGR
ncbi:MAG: hypothetical protein E7001_02970 [Coriobacteriaceae bacterium]|nr:hypothetical protein [Coriobacteriaceae bacterium]